MIARFLIGVLFFAPLPLFAAFLPTINTPLDIGLSPSSPRAGDVVTVSVENILAPGNTLFTWRVNGAVVDQGIGVTETTITAGRIGSATTVSVSASENGIPKGEKTLTLRPAEVDIVWEAHTYVPPFYEGLPLPNPDSTITLLAVPYIIQNGTRVPADDLIYTWHINNHQAPEVVGYGRSSITITPPQFLNQFSVSVSAKTRAGDVVARRDVRITPQRPSVVVYERAPLLGFRFDRAVGESFNLTEEEATFSAFPLYANTPLKAQYEWELNGVPVLETGSNSREITFRRQGEGRGAHSVSFSFETLGALFERASTNFLISF